MSESETGVSHIVVDIDNPIRLAKIWNRRCTVARLYLRDGNKCSICQVVMLFEHRFKGDPLFATIDHILPRSKGGANGMDNYRLACSKCNGERSSHYEPSMGGVRKASRKQRKLRRQMAAQAVPSPVALPTPNRNPYRSPPLTLHVQCSRCDTQYAVPDWPARYPDRLCPLCVTQEPPKPKAQKSMGG
jgi:hypothetical protein